MQYTTLILYIYIYIHTYIHIYKYIYIYIYTGWSKRLCAPDNYSTVHQVHRDILITLYIYIYIYIYIYKTCFTYLNTKCNIWKGRNCLKVIHPRCAFRATIQAAPSTSSTTYIQNMFKTATCFDQSQQQTQGCTPNKVKVKLRAEIY